MLSVLDSKGIFSFILFYLLIPKNFKEENIRFLKSLYEQYDYFNITFIKMDDRWKNAYTSVYLTIHAYYRYSLGELIHNFEKLIYLDADTICFGDLFGFYNLNFGGKIFLGRILQTNKIDSKEYYTINNGILLLNLKEMRKIKIEKMILNILKNGFPNKNLHQSEINNKWTNNFKTADQALINKYFFKYIGLIPPKYNGKHYFDYNSTIEYNKDSGNLYNNDYLYFSFKFPVIRHYPGSKQNLFYNEDWGYYARKSKYFKALSKDLSDIYNYSFIYYY
jgi:lipopolysaccharide biosynthesis glycosyltransferase